MATKKKTTTAKAKKAFKVDEFVSKYNQLMAESKLNEILPIVNGTTPWGIKLPKAIIATEAEKVIILKKNEEKEVTAMATVAGKKDKFDAFTGYSIAIMKYLTGLKNSRYERANYGDLTGATYEEFAVAFMELLGVTEEEFKSWCKPDKNGNATIEIAIENGQPFLVDKVTVKESKKTDCHCGCKVHPDDGFPGMPPLMPDFGAGLIDVLINHFLREF